MKLKLIFLLICICVFEPKIAKGERIYFHDLEETIDSVKAEYTEEIIYFYDLEEAKDSVIAAYKEERWIDCASYSDRYIELLKESGKTGSSEYKKALFINGDSKGKAGDFYFFSGNHFDMEYYQEDAMKVWLQLNDARRYQSQVVRLARDRLWSYREDWDTKCREALFLSEQGMLLAEELGKIDDDDYFLALYVAALSNDFLGNYSEAVKYGKKALELEEKLYGKEDFSRPMVLRYLSNSYMHLNESQLAMEYLKEAIELWEKTGLEYDSEHLIYSEMHYELANLYVLKGEFEEAEKLAYKLISQAEHSSESLDATKAESLIILAICETVKGKRDSAIEYCREALSKDNRVGSLRFKNTVMAVLIENGEYEYAYSIAKELKEKNEKLFGINHPEYWKLLSLMLELELHLNLSGTDKLPMVTSDFVTQNIAESVLSNFAYLPLEGRERLWDNWKRWFLNTMPALAYQNGQPERIGNAYDAALLAKGLLLNSELEFDKFMEEMGSRHLRNTYEEVKRLRQQLSINIMQPNSIAGQNIEDLKRKILMLEQQLMYDSREFGDFTLNLRINWQDVREALGEKDMAIEFVKLDMGENPVYLAYVLKKNFTSPELVYICHEEELSKTLEEDGILSDSVSAMIWEPFLDRFEDTENIYFSADGIVHQIPIEYLTTPHGTERMSQTFNLYRVASTRQVVISRRRENNKSGVVYGGIDYEADLKDNYIPKDSENKDEKKKYRNFDPTEEFGRGEWLSFLEGTKIEAENIKEMLDENNYSAILFLGEEATEQSVKNLSGKSPSILHIATHAKFWNSTEASFIAKLNANLEFLSGLSDYYGGLIEDKALTRSALFMTGSENTLSGKSKISDVIEDGILTAEEIARLDLRGTDLVVLSACQTGLGEISSEGVFGLQRGFKKAGVNSIMMSLWNVDDDATRLLMTEFYKNLMNGKSKAKALLDAQESVRNFNGKINGEERDFSSPEYWAGFILLDAQN